MEASFCSAVGPRVQYRDQRRTNTNSQQGPKFLRDARLDGSANSIRDSAWTDTVHHVSFPACNYTTAPVQQRHSQWPHGAAAYRRAPATAGVRVWFGTIRQIGRMEYSVRISEVRSDRLAARTEMRAAAGKWKWKSNGWGCSQD
jgi:hypothetical protein